MNRKCFSDSLPVTEEYAEFAVLGEGLGECACVYDFVIAIDVAEYAGQPS